MDVRFGKEAHLPGLPWARPPKPVGRFLQDLDAVANVQGETVCDFAVPVVDGCRVGEIGRVIRIIELLRGGIMNLGNFL